jgi:flavin reductase (DIM6/NTAB) family NADH-FMN oxidoreductase RutF
MTKWLPEPVRRRLRALPQWTAVGVWQPQSLIELRLKTGGAERIVTARTVVASLRPLTLAIGLDAPAAADPVARLEMFDRESRHTVGALQLQHLERAVDPRCTTAFYLVRGEEQHCLPWPRSVWNRWLQNRTLRMPSKPGNFSMPPEAVHQMMVFYMCPRPVVAVSVEHGTHRNLFPMDLIGHLDGEHFSLALRTTSPSIDAMVAAGRVAIADFPATEVRTAYALGAHHRDSLASWADASVALSRSRLFELPVPASALRVREISFLTSETIGSHRMFIGRVVSDDVRGSGPQLCHVPGIYARFRTRAGRPLPASPPG